MKARALWHTSNTSSVLKEKHLHPPRQGQLVINSSYSYISLGTEIIVSKGLVANGSTDSMKIPYMQGDFDFPLTYGYSLCGKVIEGPDEFLDKFVHLMHPHQDKLVVDIESVTVVPDGIPSHRAVLASNLETIVNAIWDGGVSIGDHVLVAGLGSVGTLLALALLQMYQVSIHVTEQDEEKLKWARDMGLKPHAGMNEKVDIAFNATGNDRGLQYCLDHTSREGTIVELSWYGNTQCNLELGNDFHFGRKKIVSSQVSRLPGIKSGRWNLPRRKGLVFDMLKDTFWDEVPCSWVNFHELPSLFDKLREGEIDNSMVKVKY